MIKTTRTTSCDFAGCNTAVTRVCGEFQFTQSADWSTISYEKEKAPDSAGIDCFTEHHFCPGCTHKILNYALNK